MLDNGAINNIIVQSELLQSLKNKELDKDVFEQYFLLFKLETFEDRLDAIFELMYNNFAAVGLASDTDYLKQIFLMVVDNDQEEIANACAILVTFVNTTLNDNMMLLEDKANQLLEIDYKILPQSRVKKYYLYYLLNILLAQPITDTELIATITKELKSFLD
jgi:hypothetical protein